MQHQHWKVYSTNQEIRLNTISVIIRSLNTTNIFAKDINIVKVTANVDSKEDVLTTVINT